MQTTEQKKMLHDFQSGLVHNENNPTKREGVAERHPNPICNWPGGGFSNTATEDHRIKLPLGNPDPKYICWEWIWNGKETAKTVGTAAICTAAQRYSLTQEF